MVTVALSLLFCLKSPLFILGKFDSVDRANAALKELGDTAKIGKPSAELATGLVTVKQLLFTINTGRWRLIATHVQVGLCPKEYIYNQVRWKCDVAFDMEDSRSAKIIDTLVNQICAENKINDCNKVFPCNMPKDWRTTPGPTF